MADGDRRMFLGLDDAWWPWLADPDPDPDPDPRGCGLSHYFLHTGLVN